MNAKMVYTKVPPLRVGVLGDLGWHEFAEAAAWLQQHARLLPKRDIAACELIVLACARRGEFTASDVERLRSAAPLARIVALTGTWCEGPWRRACDLLPGVALVSWDRWNAWADANLRQLERSRATAWSRPATTTVDELADFWSVQPLSQNRGLILIDTANPENAEVLADVVRAGGFSAVWRSPLVEGNFNSVRAIVCDLNDARKEALDRMGELSHHFSQRPILAVVDFARAEESAQILAAGAVAVVGKPFTLHEILGQLEDALRGDGVDRAVA